VGEAEQPNDCWPGEAVVVVPLPVVPDPPPLDPVGPQAQFDASMTGQAGSFTDLVTW
jgi:hypothetical protein